MVSLSFNQQAQISGADHRHFTGWQFRRVLDAPRSYFLLGQRLLCSRRIHGERNTTKSFTSWSPEILSQLPRALQLSFPGSCGFRPLRPDGAQHPFTAFLTRRGAISKTLLQVVRSNFADGLGSEAAAEMCLKLAAQDHDNRHLIWAFALEAHPAARWPSGDIVFPSFNPSMVPTRWYLKNLFVDWSSTIRAHLDQAISALSGTVLKWDHSFKVRAMLILVDGETQRLCSNRFRSFSQSWPARLRLRRSSRS